MAEYGRESSVVWHPDAASLRGRTFDRLRIQGTDYRSIYTVHTDVYHIRRQKR